MDGNPYTTLLEALGAGKATFGGTLTARRGTVTQAQPLTVAVAGLPIGPDALKINERLTKGARWAVRVTGLETTADTASLEQLEPVLTAGDEVLLLTEDDQMYYILCKVVSA